MARRLERSLLVVYIAPPHADYTALSAYPVALEHESGPASWLCEQVFAQLDFGDLPVHVAGAHGHRGRVLHHIATLCRAEAVVLGAPRRSRYRPTKSLPAWLLGRIPCPLITVP